MTQLTQRSFQTQEDPVWNAVIGSFLSIYGSVNWVRIKDETKEVALVYGILYESVCFKQAQRNVAWIENNMIIVLQTNGTVKVEDF